VDVHLTRATISAWRGYDVLGFDEAAGGDEVFRQLVLARIIEPTRTSTWQQSSLK
jgi:hypothetical protein